MPADPKIAAALKEISPQQIRGTIEKLVSFGTRLTLSAQDPGSIAAGHGIGAAREWIKSEFDRYSHDCGGCLEVRTDTFTQPPADRIPKPTEITNVYAVLRGTDPENAKRVVLVTGHYESRNVTSPLATKQSLRYGYFKVLPLREEVVLSLIRRLRHQSDPSARL